MVHRRAKRNRQESRPSDESTKILEYVMSMEDEVLFIMSDECHICGVKFLEDELRFRDHSHVTGEFRGAAHQNCNLVYQEALHVPVQQIMTHISS